MNQDFTSLYPQEITIHPFPSALKHHLRRQARSGSVIAGRSHLLYYNFIDALLEDCPCRNLTQSSKHLILSTLAGEIKGGYFGELSSVSGFVRLLSDLFTELAETGISADDLSFAAEQIPFHRDKLNQLSELYQRYESEIVRQDRLSLSGKKQKAAAVLKENRIPPILTCAKRVVFRNFHNISELDFRLLYALAKWAEKTDGEILFILPYDPDRQDAFRFLETTLRRFEAYGEQTPRLTLQLGLINENWETGGAIDHLRRRLFTRETGNRYPSDGSVEFLRGDDREGEIHAMCAKAKQLINEGTPAGNIAFVFKDPAPYLPYLTRAAENFGLDFSFQGETGMLSLPLTTILLKPFKILFSNFAREEVCDFLASPFIDPSALSSSGLRLTRQQLENITAEAAVAGDSYGTWESRLSSLLAKLPESEREPVAALRETVGSLRKLTAGLQSGKKAPAAMREMIETLKIRRQILRPNPAEKENAENLKRMRENLKLLDSFLGMLKETESSFRETGAALTAEEVFSLFTDCLKTYRNEESSLREGIAVLKLRETAGREFGCVFIGGLSEGELPSAQYENILLGDDLKRQLISVLQRDMKEQKESILRNCNCTEKERLLLEEVVSVGPFKSTAMKYWEESMLLLTAIIAAREKVCLSWHRTDADGNQLLPSYYLEHAQSWLTAPEKTGDAADGESVLSDRDSLLRRISRDLWTEKGDGGAGELAAWLKKHDGDFYERYVRDLLVRGYEEYLLSREETSRSGKIDDGALLAVLKKAGASAAKALSASALETYGHCPFLYFIDYVLKLEKTEKNDRELDPLSEGTLVHAILEEFFRQSGEEQKTPLQHAELLEKIAQTEFSKHESEKRTGEEIFWELKQKSILGTVRRWLAYEEEKMNGYRPAFFEEPFTGAADGRDSPEFRLSRGEKTFYFRGSIDRIDLGDGDFRIVDYKNSKGAFNDKKLKKPGKLAVQLPLYTLAARFLLQEKGIKTDRGKAGYAYLKKPQFREINYEKATGNPEYLYSDEENGFLGDLETLIEGIRQGNFVPSGLECKNCRGIRLCRAANEGEDDA